MGIYRSCNWIKNSRIFFSKPVIVLYIVVLIVLHIKIYKYGKLDKSDISSGDRMFRRWIQHAERQRNPPETSFNLSQCLPSHESLTDLQGIKTPFKIYIYDIPSKFNSDIVSCVQRKTLRQSCYSLDYCGMGRGLYNITDYSSVHDTHMFALEVVLHHKLMFSSFRTIDPEKADIFYIPAYVGLKCICNMMDHTQNQSVENFVSELSELLQDKHYFKQGKPHFSSVGKIQREMQYNRCPYLQSEIARNITYFGIEQEKSKHYLARYPKYGTQVISVPYPSYIHYRHTSNKHINIIKMPRLHQRNVFVLLAAGRRKTNRERAKIMQQFSVHTDLHYNIYKPYLNSSDNMVFYYTDECRKNPKWGTIPWMLRSVFCLQPPGDSPTRKSFFDAILSGCIPVLFPYADHDSAWPFMEYFTFSDFTVTFDIHKIVSGELEILDALKKISHKEIKRLHSNVKAVSKWFQYSLPDGRIQDPDDAMFYIFKELQRVYNFTISTL